MTGFQLHNLDIDDIERAQKQNIRAEEQYQANVVVDEENPLKGVVTKQRANAQKASDVLNIKSGTRCVHCGMLHFLWRENCGACKKPMDFNLGVKE